jgi:hypothetical protein
MRLDLLVQLFAGDAHPDLIVHASHNLPKGNDGAMVQ